ncbi:MAG: glycoside hydrolase family 10 protein [Aphanocapsa sp. GSE-SYN-MK-11-07L]|jgi:uncharacterized lipoprotein YddW (UPF0748 family)|nr:glycoside hydrolase family 10 protein [Aphanocapsa sp. GSE-SYN-MK-11-07L]
MKFLSIPKNWQRSLNWFLAGLFLVSFLAVPLTQSKINAQTARPEIRGVWITVNDTPMVRDHAKLVAAIDQLAQLNFNTIYPVVWNSGYAQYPSPVAQQAGAQPFIPKGSQGQDTLADLIDLAHRRGLLVIPWFEFGFMTPPTSELAVNHPDWLTQQRDGGLTSITAAGEVVWLNPFLPQVQQFLGSLVQEVVSRYDVDGIQFDDHASLPNQFGYDNYTVGLYRKETKKNPHPDPQNPDWLRWRANKITAFVDQLNKLVKTLKPRAIFSVSPAPYDFAYKAQMQDWLGWVRLNLVDELVVQVYQRDLGSYIEKISRPEMQEANQKIPTGIGILTGLRTQLIPMSLIQSQVQTARDRGFGVAFFSYESLWNYAPEPASERQFGFHNLFRAPALRARAQ